MYDTNSTRHAAALLRDYTRGTFNVYLLAGPANAGVRQQVMTAILNLPKPLPKSQCGVTVLRHHLLSATNADGNCLAVREDNMANTLKQLLNEGEQ